MATKNWKGGAAAVAQVTTITWSAYTSGETYTVTCNGKSISFVATASTQSNITTGLVAAVAASALYEFVELTASDVSNTLTFTATAGLPFTLTASATSSITATVTNTTDATGPNHFDEAQNWEGAAVPSAADDLVFDNSAYSVLYNIVDTTNYGDITIGSNFTGEIGLPPDNANGYREYRARFLKLGNGASASSVTIGLGDGRQSSRINIDANAEDLTVRVYGTGSPDASGEYPVQLQNMGADSVIDVYDGQVAILASSLTTLRVTPTEATSNVRVYVDESSTGQYLTQSGGYCEVRGSFTVQISTMGGVTRAVLDASCPVVIVGGGGVVYWETTASITTSATVYNLGKIDFSRNGKGKAALRAYLYAGGEWYDPLGIVSVPAGVQLVGCKIDDVTLDMGFNKLISNAALLGGTAVLDVENADKDLTSFVTVMTHTPDASDARTCRCIIELGDGTKNLDGTGGIFQIKVFIGGVLWNGEADEVTLGAVTRAVLQTNNFIVPASYEVIIQVLSPNAADVDVDVTATLVAE